jgi:hypothetical protein
MSGPLCRWCESKTYAEYVDVGVGWVQVTGGECLNCGAHEMGPYMTDGRITEVEMASMWHGPLEDHEYYSEFNPNPGDGEVPW